VDCVCVAASICHELTVTKSGNGTTGCHGIARTPIMGASKDQRIGFLAVAEEAPVKALNYC
jgi:hypothetical protein